MHQSKTHENLQESSVSRLVMPKSASKVLRNEDEGAVSLKLRI